MDFDYKTDPCPECGECGFMSPLVGAVDSDRTGFLRRRSPHRIGGDRAGIDEAGPEPFEAEEDWEESYYCSYCKSMIYL
ncbi:hypothetical protein [Pseudodesulfovibrio indicus]|uniref:Uncharacterized protein n=2 Tax=Pseudodesulfovibrio TaxID=2035811 RepID=A0A126QKN1_9BACT|nr:hypothetical protein [Pseudodesulfovibrio indicus]AMK10600.1 hypothetical protein AWY79_05460 [Pseudodesulfovibrio indicus]TDT82728.1 hypothetical protein EDC59_11640 [Pseudodesulfovibrio indicus]